MSTLSARIQAWALRLQGARNALLVALLGSLHLSVTGDPSTPLPRVLFLIHLGVFLIWQPFVSRERELRLTTVAAMAVLVALVVGGYAGWMAVAWMSVLTAILGGKVVASRERNWAYLIALFYLLALQLVWVVPVLMLGLQALSGVRVLVTWVLPGALLVALVLPARYAPDSAQVFDFFYAVLVFQLLAVLVLGSIAMMRLTGNQYYPSVLLTVGVFGAALSLLAVVWQPVRLFGGSGGLRLYFSRYLMSVGMPFELWMRTIADLANQEQDAGRFLERAMSHLAQLPWIEGGTWVSPDGDGTFGRHQGGYATDLQHQSLTLTLITMAQLSPSLQLHVRLLAQVIGEFYEGKRRERKLRRNAYMAAVHETGAQMTHEIKNILQSMHSLTAAGHALAPDRQGAYTELMLKALPLLTQRLGTSLARLRAPSEPAVAIARDARAWWSDFCARQEGNVYCVADLHGEATIPSAMFDSVADNLVANALAKREQFPELQIEVRLSVTSDALALSVTDDGVGVDKAVVSELLREPVPRPHGSGFGIGLYQAAQQAASEGYRLMLTSNVAGKVTFCLSRGLI